MREALLLKDFLARVVMLWVKLFSCLEWRRMVFVSWVFWILVLSFSRFVRMLLAISWGLGDSGLGMGGEVRNRVTISPNTAENVGTLG